MYTNNIDHEHSSVIDLPAPLLKTFRGQKQTFQSNCVQDSLYREKAFSGTNICQYYAALVLPPKKSTALPLHDFFRIHRMATAGKYLHSSAVFYGLYTIALYSNRSAGGVARFQARRRFNHGRQRAYVMDLPAWIRLAVPLPIEIRSAAQRPFKRPALSGGWATLMSRGFVQRTKSMW